MEIIHEPASPGMLTCAMVMHGTFISWHTAVIAIELGVLPEPISTSILSCSISLRASRVALEGSVASSSSIKLSLVPSTLSL